MLQIAIETVADRNIRIVAPKGTLDASNLAQFTSALDGLLDRETTSVVLDLREAVYLSSSAFSFIIRAADRVEDAGGTLVIAGSPPHVLEIFDLLGLRDTLPFTPTIDAAVAYIQADRPRRASKA